MRKLVRLTSILLLILAVAGSAFAAGGKVRGDKGQGGVYQIQVRNSYEGHFVF